jgi:tetratricopeptide (TPR) repeat protein
MASFCSVTLPPVFLTSALGVLAISRTAGAVERDRSDDAEIARMRARVPHAATLLEKGEALAAAGALEEADALFRQGETEDSTDSLLWRRDCEALTALGRRKEAVDACTRAMENRRSNGSGRALVRALVGGPTAPMPNDLVQALVLKSVERQKDPSQLLTALAMACDIAESLGDQAMLQDCAGKLTQIAPNGPETRRALNLLQSACPLWRFIGGWLAIVALTLVTAVRALAPIARRLRRGAVVATLGLGVLAAPRIAHSQSRPGMQQAREQLSSWDIDDDHPEKNIPSEAERNQKPLDFGYWIQDIVQKAERASKRGDHAAAARFYEALSLAVPDRSIGFTKTCDEYEALGDLEKARSACGDALLRDGVTVQDYTHFVHLVLIARLEEKDLKALANVIAHMRQDPNGLAAADDLECEVGLRTSNVAQLKECTPGLAARAPNDPRTISYQWALAVAQNKFGDADKFLTLAKSAGVTPHDLERMSKLAAAHERWHRIQVALVILGVVLMLGAIGAAGKMALRRLRDRRPHDPKGVISASLSTAAPGVAPAAPQTPGAPERLASRM